LASDPQHDLVNNGGCYHLTRMVRDRASPEP
jgi:hypothetical protein